MSYRGGYCSFEYKLENVTKLTERVYSPPFATSASRHWMLIFDPVCYQINFIFNFILKIMGEKKKKIYEIFFFFFFVFFLYIKKN
jgi:hypothetical protein